MLKKLLAINEITLSLGIGMAFCLFFWGVAFAMIAIQDRHIFISDCEMDIEIRSMERNIVASAQ